MLLELVLFRALPRRDTKGFAKRLIERFGSFAEVINAPEPRLKEVHGRRRGGHHRIEAGAGGSAAAHAHADHEAAGAFDLEAGARLPARGAEL